MGVTGGTVFDDINYLIKGSGSSKSFTAFLAIVMVVVQPAQEVLFYMVVVSIQQEE